MFTKGRNSFSHAVKSLRLKNTYKNYTTESSNNKELFRNFSLREATLSHLQNISSPLS